MTHRLDGLDDLADLVDGLEVTFPPSLQPHQQELLAALGVRVRFDAKASAPTLLKKRRPRGDTTRELVLAAMPVGKELRTAKIVELTGRDYHGVCRALGDLVEERLVLRPRRGFYVKRRLYPVA